MWVLYVACFELGFHTTHARTRTRTHRCIDDRCSEHTLVTSYVRRAAAEQVSASSQRQVRQGAADVTVRGMSVVGDAGVVNSHVLTFRWAAIVLPAGRYLWWWWLLRNHASFARCVAGAGTYFRSTYATTVLWLDRFRSGSCGFAVRRTFVGSPSATAKCDRKYECLT